MTTKFLGPDPAQSTFFIPGTNTPGNGVLLFTYLAGTTTKETVYKDNAGASSWSNPIILDSGGNLTSGGTVWLTQGLSYKLVWAPANDTDPPASPYRTIDNVSGINDITLTSTGEWVSGSTPTFIGASSFSIAGDQTSTYHVGRRLKFTVTAGTVYGTIRSASFGAGITTITMNMDSTSLDSGLATLFYSPLDSVNPSLPIFGVNGRGASIAAASTTNIWATGGDYVHITSAVPIGAFSAAASPGAEMTIVFDTATPINYSSTTLIIPGGANITTFAGDIAVVRADSATKNIITQYQSSQNLFRKAAAATRQVFTTTGVYTTPNNVLFANVRLVGGGGGGGGQGAGTSAGTNGSTTAFGALLQATGGVAGQDGSGTQAGGTGGIGSGGEINLSGNAGTNGGNTANTGGGGNGGGSMLGGGALGASPGGTGGNFGGGGGGGGAPNLSNCGGGGGGGGYSEGFLSAVQLGSTTSVTVGNAGTGGTGTNAGGPGAKGVVIIDEYYNFK